MNIQIEERGDLNLRLRATGGEGRAMREALGDIQNAIYVEAAATAPGHLERAIERRRPTTLKGGDQFVANIRLTNKPKHTRWVHEGTGLFGPRAKRIVSPSGNVMQFVSRGSNVFTHSTQGQRPQPFFREAVEKIRRTYIPARIKQLQLELGLKGRGGRQ